MLFVGVGMAALALVVCAGVGGMAVLQGGESPTTAAVGIDGVAQVDEAPETADGDEALTDLDPTGEGSAAALEEAEPPPEPAATSPSRTREARRTGGASSASSRTSGRRTASQAAPPPRLPPQPLPLPSSEPDPDPEASRDGPVDLDRAARSAGRGGLDSDTRRRLEDTRIDDPTFTRAYTILAADAQARGDTRAAEGYLERLMALGENRFNPVLLSELARLQVNGRRYASALRNANTAEQHWARIPSSVMFERKAEIYEVQAAATQGLLYESDDEREQLDLLEDALKRWTRYREHADAGARVDLVARADTQLDKLRAIRSRLE